MAAFPEYYRQYFKEAMIGLGHSTIAMTLDVYGHLCPRHNDSRSWQPPRARFSRNHRESRYVMTRPGQFGLRETFEEGATLDFTFCYTLITWLGDLILQVPDGFFEPTAVSDIDGCYSKSALQHLITRFESPEKQ